MAAQDCHDERITHSVFHGNSFTVTVPEGIAPGQTIAVLAPDGSRLVKATIPPGLNAGDSFLVRLAKPIPYDSLNAPPLQPSSTTPNFSNALDNYMTPAPTNPNFATALNNWMSPTPEQSVAAEKDQSKEAGKVADVVATPLHGNGNLASRDAAPAVVSPQVFGQRVNAQVEVAETREDPDAGNATIASAQQNTISTKQQKFLLVHVPPGMPAGSTMQVEVPDENRTIATTVPAGVQSFHIAYTPRPQQQPMRSVTPPQPQPRPQQQQQQQPYPSSLSAGQKLLVVRVPRGTLAGTTLHVSVPDEPGRILAAQVPPGNVHEFHVSYEARPHANAQRSAPSYGQPQQAQFGQRQPGFGGQQGQGNYYPQQQQHQQQRMAPYNNGNNGGSGMGNFLLPFLGGAAMGAAGAATYDHFAHNNDNNNAYANDPATGDAGGYTGGDYGGDGDYGGGDYVGGDMGGDFGF